MKDRVILLTSTVLIVTVALFAWFTWARWGVVGISPGIRWLVLGSAAFALVMAGLFLFFTRRTSSTGHRPASPAHESLPPVATASGEPENTKVTAVEAK